MLYSAEQQSTNTSVHVVHIHNVYMLRYLYKHHGDSKSLFQKSLNLASVVPYVVLTFSLSSFRNKEIM